MKLVRFGAQGQEKPGLLDAAGGVRDLSAHTPDIAREALSPVGLTYLSALDPESLPPVEGSPRLGPCVAPGSKIIGVGLNYSDHAEEMGLEIPSEPVTFLMAPSSLAGPYDPLPMPADAEKLDYEVELGFVIGSTAQRVSEDEAMAHVAGFCTFNDVTDRSWQFDRLGQWSKAKSHDGFGPTGPCLVTPDEVPDVSSLTLRTWVNGEIRQEGTSAKMAFKIPQIVSYLSRFMTLEPGDIIATGTPPGVALSDGRYLQVGDVVEIEVEGLGRQRTEITAA